MKVQKFYGTILTASSDFQPILNSVLEKFGIHDFALGFEPLAETLSADIDPEDIRKEIKKQLQQKHEIFHPKAQSLKAL